jgi:hypothetical protein
MDDDVTWNVEMFMFRLGTRYRIARRLVRGRVPHKSRCISSHLKLKPTSLINQDVAVMRRGLKLVPNHWDHVISGTLSATGSHLCACSAGRTFYPALTLGSPLKKTPMLLKRGEKSRVIDFSSLSKNLKFSSSYRPVHLFSHQSRFLHQIWSKSRVIFTRFAIFPWSSLCNLLSWECYSLII